MTARRSVVISGIGVVCPLGDTPAELAAALREGRDGLTAGHWDLPDGTLSARVGRCRPPPEAAGRSACHLDPMARFAIAAAQRAFDDAARPSVAPARAAVFLGIGFGGLTTLAETLQTVNERGARRVSPWFVPAAIGSTAAGSIAADRGWVGPGLTLATACAAGAMAVGEGYRRIAAGELDVALCGGAEAPLAAVTIAGFRAMRVLGRDGARPFAADRDGMALGEGAAFLLLEAADRARDRRVRLYAEVLGYGTAADAHHPTDSDPQGRGAERAIRMALHEARRRGDDLDYVHAHAAGTVAGDAVEAAVLARVLGAGAARTWVSSTKGATGHLLGAAGALETAITALTIQSGLLPANLPDSTADPACALRLVERPGMQASLRTALKTSFGFGGVNAALVLGAPDLTVG